MGIWAKKKWVDIKKKKKRELANKVEKKANCQYKLEILEVYKQNIELQAQILIR